MVCKDITMLSINILTKGFLSRNGKGFLVPLLSNRNNLKELGIKFQLYWSLDDISLGDCDLLIIESLAIKQLYWGNFIRLEERISDLTKQTRVIFFDLNDSCGPGFFRLLPFVSRYCKSYVYRDKSLYMKKYYGDRIWTDYYHKKYEVSDVITRKPDLVNNISDLNKIHVGYLAGLVNFYDTPVFRRLGATLNYLERIKILHPFYRQRRIRNVRQPSTGRKLEVSCRFNIHQGQKTIGFHRNLAKSALKGYVSTDKISKKHYIDEIRNTKIVVSPFGWGELNVARDYECAIHGALLIKPDFKFMETFPNLFNTDTVEIVDWDFNNLEAQIKEILNNYSCYIEKAIEFQNRYLYYLCDTEGRQEFCNHFTTLIE